MVSALRHGFSGRRSHVGTAERGRYSVPRTKKRWHPTASPARDDMPKCCLFAAASSAYERHTNKVNSRVDDFTLWEWVGASTLLLNIGGREGGEGSGGRLGFSAR